MAGLAQALGGLAASPAGGGACGRTAIQPGLRSVTIDRRRLLSGFAAFVAIRTTPAFAIPNEEEIKMTETNLVELRQYTLVGGQRDTLVDLFARAFEIGRASGRERVCQYV